MSGFVLTAFWSDNFCSTRCSYHIVNRQPFTLRLVLRGSVIVCCRPCLYFPASLPSAALPTKDITRPHCHSLSRCSPKQCVLHTIPQSADNFHCFSRLVARQNRVSDTRHNRAQTTSTVSLVSLLATTGCFALATTERGRLPLYPSSCCPPQQSVSHSLKQGADNVYLTSHCPNTAFCIYSIDKINFYLFSYMYYVYYHTAEE